MNWSTIKKAPVFKYLPTWIFNKYFLVLAIYVTYMTFFDSNHFRSQMKLKKQVNTLEKQKDYYELELKNVQKERSLLFSNTKNMERFARENYYMKREGETVYVFVEEN